jgi:hypothetical protein
MLDSRKVDNLIQNLVNHENSMKQLDVEAPIKVQLSKDGKTIQFIHNGLVLNGAVERPLIHQLGSRAWGQNQDFNLIAERWKQMFKNNRVELEQELASTFNRHNLSIRYHSYKGQNQIYGIVIPHFVDVNQLEFRQHFMEQIRHTTALRTCSKFHLKA